MEENKFLPVSEWSDEDRPREKMLHLGKKSMTNAELIAILLRSGVRGRSAVDVAKEVLAAAGNSLTTLSLMDYAQLNRTKGMALAKTSSLMAALELGWRMQSEIAREKSTILDRSEAIFNYIKPDLADLDHEEFWVVFLNARNQALGHQRISMGGITETSVDLRILFRSALEHKAVRIAVMHNHPSGRLNPSSKDRELTHNIRKAGQLLNIELVDHLIIGRSEGSVDYYSFCDSGLL